MNKKGQIDNVITSIPVIFLLAALLVIFIFISSLLGAVIRPEIPPSKIGIDNKNIENSFNLDNILLQSIRIREDSILLIEALKRSLDDEYDYVRLTEEMKQTSTDTSLEEERNNLIGKEDIEESLKLFMLQGPKESCVILGIGESSGADLSSRVRKPSSVAINRDIYLMRKGDNVERFDPYSSYDLYFPSYDEPQKISSQFISSKGKEFKIEYYYGECLEENE